MVLALLAYCSLLSSKRGRFMRLPFDSLEAKENI